jgi:preprotein translocase subunit YajC
MEYIMMYNLKIGDKVETHNGTIVKILGFTDDGEINVELTHGAETIEYFRRLGVTIKYFEATWSQKEFDSLVTYK